MLVALFFVLYKVEKIQQIMHYIQADEIYINHWLI